jgi:hypothetical protein
MSGCISAKNLFHPAAARASSEQHSETKYDNNPHHDKAGQRGQRASILD